MSDNLIYPNTVSEEEFQEAMQRLEIAIAAKDTPEEWVKFTGRIVLLAGKLAINQFGFGPAIQLFKEVFGEENEILKLLELLNENR